MRSTVTTRWAATDSMGVMITPEPTQGVTPADLPAPTLQRQVHQDGPLPAEVTQTDLDRLATRPVGATEVPYGLADDPVRQAQPPAVLDLAGTDRLLCGGGPQSGRTTFARTLTSELAARFTADQVHLYVIENQPAGLAAYG